MMQANHWERETHMPDPIESPATAPADAVTAPSQPDVLSSIFGTEQPIQPIQPITPDNPLGDLELDGLGTQQPTTRGREQPPQTAPVQASEPPAASAGEEAPDDEAAAEDDGNADDDPAGDAPDDSVEGRLAKIERDYKALQGEFTRKSQELSKLKQGQQEPVPATATATPKETPTTESAGDEPTPEMRAACARFDKHVYDTLMDNDGKGFTESMLGLIERRANQAAERIAARLVEERLAPVMAALSETVAPQYFEREVGKALVELSDTMGVPAEGLDAAAVARETRSLAEAQGVAPNREIMLQAALKMALAGAAAPAAAAKKPQLNPATPTVPAPVPGTPANTPPRKAVSRPPAPHSAAPAAGGAGLPAGRGNPFMLQPSGNVVHQPQRGGIDDL
jgi:hypothetical protein